MKEVKSPKRPLAYYYIIALVLLLLFNFLVAPSISQKKVTEVNYSTFMHMIEDRDVGKVEITDTEITFTSKDESRIYKTGVMNDPELIDRLYQSGAKFTREIETTMSPGLTIFLSFILPVLIFIILGEYLRRKMMQSAGGKGAMAFGMGKSNARRST
jgi:cell division protease FtsH